MNACIGLLMVSQHRQSFVLVQAFQCPLTIRPVGWPGFKSHVIANQCREMLIPKPLNGLCGALDADVVVPFLATFDSLVRGGFVIPLDPTSPQHQEIPGAELDPLMLGDFDEVVVADAVLARGAVFAALFGRP